MIPSDKELKELSRTNQGDLKEVPFPVLLTALFAHKRTLVLELKRGPAEKLIVLEEGVPVDCRGNLLHETLGKFLVAEGRITEEQYQKALSVSIKKGEMMGSVLIQAKLLTAFDLFKALQQNLARKLLDVFTWEGGTFRALADLPDIDSSLKVNLPQLVLTGVSRFAPQRHVDSAVQGIAGAPLGVHPDPGIDPEGLRMNPKQARLLKLLDKGLTLETAQMRGGMFPDEVTRFLYAMAVLGVVGKKADLPDPVKAPAAQPLVAATPMSVVLKPLAKTAGADELMQLYLSYRKKDAIDLLNVPERGTQQQFDDAWIAFAERFAPWHYTSDEQKPLADKARDIFQAGARAYGELSDPERRNSLIHRRKTLREGKKAHNRFAYAIKTELLDADSQFKEGRQKMQAGDYMAAERLLEYAVELQPAKGSFRAELAYCRFLRTPDIAPKCLEELAYIHRLDPACGVAWFYAGEIKKALGDMKGAAEAYAHAQKRMKGDPRPAQALRALQAAQRK